MPRDPRSFRFSSKLLEALADRARVRGETQTALAERYLEEGLRRDEHPLITFRDGAAGRRPALVGTRLDVLQVIDTLRASDNSVADAAAYLELPESYVRACVRYYAAYTDEVDAWRERVAEIAAREEEAWKREQAVLA
jgi:uncharacterized protein (DUF433 family)